MATQYTLFTKYKINQIETENVIDTCMLDYSDSTVEIGQHKKY